MNEDVKKILDTYFSYLVSEYNEIEKVQLEPILRSSLLNILCLNSGITGEEKLVKDLQKTFPEKRVKSMTEEYRHGLLIASMKCVNKVKEAC